MAARKKNKNNEKKDQDKDVSEVSYEEILNNPESYSDNLEAKEDISWCPDCGDYSIHVDAVCSVCGHSKKALTHEDEEIEESTEDSIGYLLDDKEEDLISELGYSKKHIDDDDGDE